MTLTGVDGGAAFEDAVVSDAESVPEMRKCYH